MFIAIALSILVFASGVGVGVVAARRWWPRVVEQLVVTEPSGEPPRKRFRILFDTDDGGNARRAFEALVAKRGEGAVLYDGLLIRGRRDGA